ncbi:MAG: hypothetical protein KAZ47_00930 [Streptococcus sp.]|nr:hypothetical protein [Streptococcus sp.]
MIKYNKVDLLFGKKIKLAENVGFEIPTVEDMCYIDNFGLYTQPLVTTTREMFSAHREVDAYEAKFPNVWKMVFDEEGNQILGQMYAVESGMNIIIEALSFWTKLPIDSFKVLTNKKIINEQAKWVIDEKVFLEFCELIKDVTNHQVNEELVAPRNMSERQLGVWEKLYKGRMRKLQKGSRTIGDKILILSISMDSYIPINEIRKMTIFHFNKLYEAISEKESYEAMWDIKMSPKFDSKNSGDSKHWKESFKL